MQKVLAAVVLGLLAASPGLAGATGDRSLPLATPAAAPMVPIAQDDVSAALSRFAAEFARVRPGGRDSGSAQPALTLFEGILNRVQREYVRSIPASALVEAAVAGLKKEKDNPKRTDQTLVEAAFDSMLSSLDPYSAYLNVKDFRDMQEQTHGEFGGLGVEVSMDKVKGLVKVVSPIDDTPASRAGLRTGDLVTHIDGQAVKGISLNDAVSRMRGPVGTTIRLTVRRGESAEPFIVPLTRAVIRIQPVRFRVEDNVGYIRVTTFLNDQTTGALEQAMRSIKQQLGTRLAGLVLDLRNNPGGLLPQAVSVADLFLDSGSIVSIRGRNPSDNQVYNAKPGDVAHGLPIVVLINGGSASASEIVAAALQDHQRALVFGTQSYGKGTVQTVTPLTGSTAVRLTTARYQRPNGTFVDCLGVAPNIIVKTARAGDAEEEPHQKGDHCEGLVSEAPPVLSIPADRLCPAPSGKPDEDRPLDCALAAVRHHLVGQQRGASPASAP